MKLFIGIPLLAVLFFACDPSTKTKENSDVNWDSRVINRIPDSLSSGSTYLSVYSEIYSRTDKVSHGLTATVSLRNTDRKDTLFLERVDYFGTNGALIKSHLEKPIYLGPMETIEIIIDEEDKQGGSGANFMFDWKISTKATEPIFECVMISTVSQQGLSFTTQGKRIR